MPGEYAAGRCSVTTYIPGTDPLAPMPLTAYQVHDLIDRAHLARERARLASFAAGGAAAAALRCREQPVLQVRLGRVAARYARMFSCSLSEATRVVRSIVNRVSEKTTARQWHKLYPGVPARVAKRTRLIRQETE